MIPFETPVQILLRGGGEIVGELVAGPDGLFLVATPDGPAVIARSAIAAIRRLPPGLAPTTGPRAYDLYDLQGRDVRVIMAGAPPVAGLLVDAWPGRAGVDIQHGDDLLSIPIDGTAIVPMARRK